MLAWGLRLLGTALRTAEAGPGVYRNRFYVPGSLPFAREPGDAAFVMGFLPGAAPRLGGAAAVLAPLPPCSSFLSSW